MLSARWTFPLLLAFSTGVLAAPSPVLEVVASSATTPTDSFRNSCVLNTANRVVIERTAMEFSTGQTLRAVENKMVKFNMKELKAATAQAAMGTVTGQPLIGGATYQYFVFDKMGQAVLLYTTNGSQQNDAPNVSFLKNFADQVCGDMSLPQ